MGPPKCPTCGTVFYIVKDEEEDERLGDEEEQEELDLEDPL